MSLSIVRKGLELSSELSIVNKKTGKKGKHSKIVKHNKKKTPEEIKRENLKLILGLDNALSFGSTTTATDLVKKGSKNQSKSIKLPLPVKDKQDKSPFTEPETASGAGKKGKNKKSKNKQTKKNQDSIFTEEDFEKFEKEYFVTG